MGKTPYDINSVNEIFKLYIPFWLGKSYNLFQKNCNDFTKFFSGLLLRTNNVANYPDYVNRITIFADYFNIFYNPIKKLYFETNNAPFGSSSLNSEFIQNENRDNNNNINENKENNNEKKEMDKENDGNDNIENNDINNAKENREENNPDNDKKDDIKNEDKKKRKIVVVNV